MASPSASPRRSPWRYGDLGVLGVPIRAGDASGCRLPDRLRFKFQRETLQGVDSTG